MDRLIGIGRVFFALGIIALGVMQFIYGDFVAGRAPPWPEALPGQLVWAYLTGIILMGGGLAIILQKYARPGALLAGTIILLWAVLRLARMAAGDPTFGGIWTQFGKSLFLFAGAFAIAGSFPAMKYGGPLVGLINAGVGFLYLARVCLGFFMILCGFQHFMFTEFVETLIPSWMPGSLFWTYSAGLALIAGGSGLLIPQAARPAAALSGLMVFIWFIILHIPRAVAAAEPFDVRNEWTSVFEALAVAGLAFFIAGMLSKRDGGAAQVRPGITARTSEQVA